MYPEHSHIIHKQELQVHLTHQVNATEIGNRIEKIYHEKLMPALDAILTGFSSKDHMLIDRLEIELPLVQEPDIELKIPDLFIQTFLKSFSDAVEENKNFNDHSMAVQTARMWIDGSDQVEGSELFTDDNNIIKITPADALRQQLIYYLEKGSMPWWTPKVNMRNLEKEWIERDNGVFSDAVFVKRLTRLLRNNTIALHRFIMQFTDKFIMYLVNSAATGDQILFLPGTLYKALKNDIPYTRLRTTFWEIACEDILSTNSVRNDKILRDVLNKLSEKNHIRLSEWLQVLTSEVIPDLEPAAIEIARTVRLSIALRELSGITEGEIIRSYVTSDAIREARIPDSPDSSDTSRKLPHENKQIHKTDGSLSNIEYQITKSELNGEEYFIDHAGLILLHPFLPSFFNNINFTRPKAFINEEFRERALHVLAYLTTGTECSPESELIFEKILCGWELNEPVHRVMPLLDHEKEASRELLTAVIDHWKALKNTSIEGLQESFLIRAGKITVKEENYLLQVERSSYDTLLNMLPWSFSIVKTPWMKMQLITEW